MFGKIGAVFSSGSLDNLDTTILVNEWDTLHAVFDKVSSGLTPLKLKRFLKNNPEVISTLQPWSYIFSWDYSFGEFFEFLDAWPQVKYASVTLLEGRSMYDMDAALTRKEYIYEWEYKEFVQNELIISKYTNKYEFLELAAQDWDLVSLEWFLYPDTYFIDASKDFIDQLVFLQLESFSNKVWIPNKEAIISYNQTLGNRGIDTSVSFYEMIILASIIEKEERVNENKVKIASVFLNRLVSWMRIDADISLCYGLETPYEECTPAVIGANVSDATNIYNTRAVGWLTPTPIANIHVSSLEWLLSAQASSNFFYLHDDKGGIHLAEDLSWHNINKSKYIK